MRFHCLVIALLFTQAVFGQTATLRGQVTDESGAVVPRAKVTLAGHTGAVKSAVADNGGSYTFAGMAPGEYTVQASAPELSLAPLKVTLMAGAQALNLMLTVASISEKVTVQDYVGAGVDHGFLQQCQRGGAARRRSRSALRRPRRPGCRPAGAGRDPRPVPTADRSSSMASAAASLPPKESIREIRINQNPFSPEYDKLGYGKIEIFTKPGSDKYRGTAQWNFANDFWNTRNPYAPNKAPFLLNEFEGNAGGPLTKKSSFTIDAQRNMVDNGSITNAVTSTRRRWRHCRSRASSPRRAGSPTSARASITSWARTTR